ncbi:uncharacterized protein LOC127867627 [Dreissena polymorpha]|uniref:uncharacterized protein LOC127867627 n=1 Tax=Dreissena polymorpha TaxID=45954 RepID=UPI0022650442|nr:uncharacterized protein LOC127867627 [Dreissena polymorpha]
MDARLLLVLMGIFQTAFGAVSIGSIETRLEHGTEVKFCTYKGMRLLPTSIIIDYDACNECHCNEDGLRCYSVGYTVSAIGKSKCTNVKIACQNTWVLKSNKKKPCPKHLIPKSVTAVGK